MWNLNNTIYKKMNHKYEQVSIRQKKIWTTGHLKLETVIKWNLSQKVHGKWIRKYDTSDFKKKHAKTEQKTQKEKKKWKEDKQLDTIIYISREGYENCY